MSENFKPSKEQANPDNEAARNEAWGVGPRDTFIDGNDYLANHQKSTPEDVFGDLQRATTQGYTDSTKQISEMLGSDYAQHVHTAEANVETGNIYANNSLKELTLMARQAESVEDKSTSMEVQNAIQDKLNSLVESGKMTEEAALLHIEEIGSSIEAAKPSAKNGEVSSVIISDEETPVIPGVREAGNATVSESGESKYDRENREAAAEASANIAGKEAERQNEVSVTEAEARAIAAEASKNAASAAETPVSEVSVEQENNSEQADEIAPIDNEESAEEEPSNEKRSGLVARTRKKLGRFVTKRIRARRYSNAKRRLLEDEMIAEAEQNDTIETPDSSDDASADAEPQATKRRKGVEKIKGAYRNLETRGQNRFNSSETDEQSDKSKTPFKTKVASWFERNTAVDTSKTAESNDEIAPDETPTEPLQTEPLTNLDGGNVGSPADRTTEVIDRPRYVPSEAESQQAQEDEARFPSYRSVPPRGSTLPPPPPMMPLPPRGPRQEER